MSLDKALPTEENRTWEQRAWAQYKKIIAHREFIQAKEERDILEFLMKNEFKEIPIEITQEHILDKVFSNHGGVTNVGHRVKDLRTKLTFYYLEYPDDEIIIECPKRAHRLLIRPNPKLTAENKDALKQPAAEEEQRDKRREMDQPTEPLKQMLEGTTEDAQIIYPWSQDKVDRLLREAQPKTEVRILTPVFTNWSIMRPKIIEMLENDVLVKIVLMNPNITSLVIARFGLRADHPPTQAENLIRGEIIDLEDLCTQYPENLEVRLSILLPFAFYMQSESKNEILLGFVLPLSAHYDGPMVTVAADSKLGRRLQKNWLGYWALWNKAELGKIEGKATIKQVWLATPNLSNDIGNRASFSEVVEANAARGVKYTLLFPRQQVTEKQLQEFRALFPTDQATGKRLGLTEIPLESEEFLRLTPIQKATPHHIVIFNPEQDDNQAVEVFIEMPAESLWRKLDGDEAKTTLDKFTIAIQRHFE